LRVLCVRACVCLFVGVAIVSNDIEHWSAFSKAARTPRRLAQDAVETRFRLVGDLPAHRGDADAS